MLPGSGGLGLHAATAFLRAGAKTVFITARKQKGLDEAVNELNKLPGISGKAIGIAANVAATEAIQQPFEPTPDSASQKVLDLNVRGVFMVGPGSNYMTGVDISLDGGSRLVQGTLSKL
ncbi:NAD(P)-binding protein [Aspergillus terreus]|uniref:NAD(P)-binding protein n=1 Tax=Aspergillus terreus TaxID=33178 RepID=A0A5M3Z3L6_ASPTE|nr:hypothetical protein ATETN484_0008052100 [Aspergillus terreus]GFF21349.1 NAD(P)-binding protein [Aspergillus terreus]